MKIDINSSEVVRLGESLDTEKSFSFDENSSFLVDALINLYENPVKSVVREICSNAYDATIENKNIDQDLYPDKFIVYLDKQKFIVQDFGSGMSPEFFNNYYTKIGFSTKRDNSEQIGGFGLGRLSVLSFVDSFKVVTVYDKVRYEYIVFKDNGVKTDLLSATPVTDEVGTRIEIVYNSSDDDYNGKYKNLFRAIKYELKYFTGFKAVVNPVNYDVNFSELKEIPFQYLECKFPIDKVAQDLLGIEEDHVLTLKDLDDNSSSGVCLGKVEYDFSANDKTEIFKHVKGYVDRYLDITKKSTYIDSIQEYYFFGGNVYIPLSYGLKPTPSRESLLMNDTNKRIIARFKAAILISVINHIEDFNSFPFFEQFKIERNEEYRFNWNNWALVENSGTKRYKDGLNNHNIVGDSISIAKLENPWSGYEYSCLNIYDNNLKLLDINVNVIYRSTKYKWLTEEAKSGFKYLRFHQNITQLTYNNSKVYVYKKFDSLPSKLFNKKTFKDFFANYIKPHNKYKASVIQYQKLDSIIMSFYGYLKRDQTDIFSNLFKEYFSFYPIKSYKETYSDEEVLVILDNPNASSYLKEFILEILEYRDLELASYGPVEDFQTIIDAFEHKVHVKKEQKKEEQRQKRAAEKEQIKKLEEGMIGQSKFNLKVKYYGGVSQVVNFLSNDIQYVFYGIDNLSSYVQIWLSKFKIYRKNKTLYQKSIVVYKMTKATEKILMSNPVTKAKLINLSSIETMIANQSNLPRVYSLLKAYRAEKYLKISKWRKISDYTKQLSTFLYDNMCKVEEYLLKTQSASLNNYYDKEFYETMDELYDFLEKESIANGTHKEFLSEMHIPGFNEVYHLADFIEFLQTYHNSTTVRQMSLPFGFVQQHWNAVNKVRMLSNLKSVKENNLLSFIQHLEQEDIKQEVLLYADKLIMKKYSKEESLTAELEVDSMV